MYNLFHIEYFLYRGYYNVAIEPLLVTVSQMTIINANNEKKEKRIKKKERKMNLVFIKITKTVFPCESKL